VESPHIQTDLGVRDFPFPQPKPRPRVILDISWGDWPPFERYAETAVGTVSVRSTINQRRIPKARRRSSITELRKAQRERPASTFSRPEEPRLTLHYTTLRLNTTVAGFDNNVRTDRKEDDKQGLLYRDRRSRVSPVFALFIIRRLRSKLQKRLTSFIFLSCASQHLRDNAGYQVTLDRVS
jgi:hypothetical protein